MSVITQSTTTDVFIAKAIENLGSAIENSFDIQKEILDQIFTQGHTYLLSQVIDSSKVNPEYVLQLANTIRFLQRKKKQGEIEHWEVLETKTYARLEALIAYASYSKHELIISMLHRRKLSETEFKEEAKERGYDLEKEESKYEW